jgi:CheY-like chemotaxis protein
MVYLVDDDIDDLEIVQEALRSHSYKGPVAIASNGKILMDQLHIEKKPDVILLDLNMPLKDGFQVMKEMMMDASLKEIPVIVLTSSSNKRDEIRCFELGCKHYYTKPDKIDDYQFIVNTVKTFIAKQSMH